MLSAFRSNKRRMKAQGAIFEQVMLFVMVVTIFIMYFAVFNIYEGYFMSVGTNDQMTQMKNYISSGILRVASREDAVESSITLKIPKKIGNRAYIIKLSNKGLNITCPSMGISKHSELYNINESMGLSGDVMSLGGKVIIYKKGNEIRLI